ncbi:endocuticle structural glycoprotein SgAbd-8-like [Tigriopus californicus]|uniref:endocuticle structural glycoprotein SgAbd-8-like n=1 Tax=Tigriopus californicus TaxID=6832 RepID=UPI0027DA11E5|nr:endocuticle structural glycoprotein SgAbd-8-like [Tigriopus californicus]
MTKFFALLGLISISTDLASSRRVSRQVPPYNGVAGIGEPIAILKSDFNTPSAETPNFDYSFATENGIQQEVSGQLKRVEDHDVMVMRGSYTYVDTDGRDVLVTWYADETGFHPTSDNLPVAPAIPFPEQAAAVAQQIQFAAAEDQNRPVARDFNNYGNGFPSNRQFNNFQSRSGGLSAFTDNYQG